MSRRSGIRLPGETTKQAQARRKKLPYGGQLPAHARHFPCGGFTSKSWVEVPVNVVATAPEQAKIPRDIRGTLGDSRWDADHGKGAARRIPPMTEQELGYTAREDNPNARPLKNADGQHLPFTIERKGRLIVSGTVRWSR